MKFFYVLQLIAESNALSFGIATFLFGSIGKAVSPTKLNQPLFNSVFNRVAMNNLTINQSNWIKGVNNA